MYLCFIKSNINNLNSNDMKTFIQSHQITISNILFVALIAAVAVLIFTSKFNVYFSTM